MSAKGEERFARERLLAERDELLNAVSDLDREYAAGDLSEEDFSRLRNRYVARTVALTGQLQRDADAASGDTRTRGGFAGLRHQLGRSRMRRRISALLLLWFIAGVTLFALHIAGVRLPGQSATGSISLSQSLLVEQELAQASSLAGSGQISVAISLYGHILSQVPLQHEALTYQGWLIRLSGIDAHQPTIVQRGDAEIAHAVAIAPGYPDARGLGGIARYEDERNGALALRDFAALLSDHPSTALLQALAPQVSTIYRALGHSVPTAIAAALRG